MRLIKFTSLFVHFSYKCFGLSLTRAIDGHFPDYAAFKGSGYKNGKKFCICVLKYIVRAASRQ